MIFLDLICKKIKRVTDYELENIDYNVVQSNMLVSAEYFLPIVEHKVINATISQIGQFDKKIKPIQFTVAQICELSGFPKKNIKRILDSVAKNLMARTFSIYSDVVEDGVIKRQKAIYHWVNFVKYTDNLFTVCLSEEIYPFLFLLKDNFTQRKIEFLKKYKNELALRLDMFFTMSFNRKTSKMSLKQKKNYTLKLSFSVKEFREIFGYENNYPRTYDFYEYILKPALEDIERLEGFDVLLEKSKSEGNNKQYNCLIFFVRLGKKHDVFKDSEIKKNKKLQESYLGKILNSFGFTEKEIINLKKEYAEEYIISILKEMKKSNLLLRNNKKEILLNKLKEEKNILKLVGLL